MVDTDRLKESFGAVAAHGDEVPLYFYSHLFLCYPETRPMFPVSMMQQRDRLFRALGRVVSEVDQLDRLVPFLSQLGRDHRKFGALSGHYPAVGASLIATLKHFSGPAWTPDLEADWAAAYGLVAKAMTDAAEEASDSPAVWEAKVVAIEKATFDVSVIRVQPLTDYPYAAGQSVSLETDLRPRMWRYYSIANAPRPDGTLDLHVELVDGGPVSSALVRLLTVGDVVRLGPPVGALRLDPHSDRDLLLVGGGTGIAPLKALLEQLAALPSPRRTHLFAGARSVRSLYDLEALEDLEERHRWLTVTPVVSDDDTWPGERGLLPDVVADHGPWRHWDVYVCGAPEMVQATVSRLVADHVPEQRIRHEEFSTTWPGPEAQPASEIAEAPERSAVR